MSRGVSASNREIPGTPRSRCRAARRLDCACAPGAAQRPARPTALPRAPLPGLGADCGSSRPGSTCSAAAKWAAQVDYRDRFGLLALTGADHRIVGHAVYRTHRRRSGGGRLRGRRRPSGPGPWHDPARAPGRGGRGAGRLSVRGGGAAAEPPHDRGLPRKRIRRPNALAAGPRGRSSSQHRCRRTPSSASRSASGARLRRHWTTS